MFIELWRSCDSTDTIKKSRVDLIVPICYGLSGYQRLSVATKLNLEMALEALRISPEAIIAFGNCSYIFPGSEKVESELKNELLKSVDRSKILEVTITNSIDESEHILEVVRKAGVKPRCILIITGELHSRSVRYIWKRVFPEAQIIIACINYRNEVEIDHLIPIQRTISRWIFANIARQLLLRIFGFSIRHLHHRSDG